MHNIVSKRKVAAAVLALCLLMPAMAQDAHAGTEGRVKYSKKLAVIVYDRFPSYYRFTDLRKLGKFQSMKSSDKKVLAVNKDMPGRFRAKKPGKATLTIKTRKDGEKRKYKCKVTVKRYSNPLKSFNFGGSELNGLYMLNSDADWIYTGEKARVKIIPKKGWELKGIRLEYEGEDVEDTGAFRVKNNTTIELKDLTFYEETLRFNLYNKRDKTTVPMWLEIEKE